MATWQKIYFAPEQKYLTWLKMEMTKQDLDTNLSSPLLYVDGMHRRPPWTRWAKLLWHQRELSFLLFSPRSPLPTQFVDEEEGRRWQSHGYKNVYSKVLIWLQSVIQCKGSHRKLLFKPFLKQILEGAPEEYDPWLTSQRAKAVKMNTKHIKSKKDTKLKRI